MLGSCIAHCRFSEAIAMVPTKGGRGREEDCASTHVHPMAGDGEADFTALIFPPGAVKLPEVG